MAEERDTILDSLLERFVEGDSESLARELETRHPADIADALRNLNDTQAIKVFAILSEEDAADVLAEVEEDLRGVLTTDLPEGELSEILDEMEPDDAADVVGEIEEEDPGRARRVLDLMSEIERDEVEELLEHDEESAGGIMTTEYLAFPEIWSVQKTVDFLRQAPPDIHYNTAFTVDPEGRFRGVLPLQRLIWSSPDDSLASLSRAESLSVTAETDQEEVARLFAKYDLVSLPVVDENGFLTGRITVDDILDVVEDESSEDMLKLAGTTEDELISRSAWTAARLRLPWMLVALAGGIGCLLLLSQFEDNIARFTYLSFFFPMIMAMGGNIGSQSSTVIVRGLALGQIGTGRLAKTVLREGRTGLLMGSVCGLIGGGASSMLALFSDWPATVGIIVGLSLLVSMCVASLFASIVPLMFSRFKIDPAIASGPLITMSNDVIGLVVYLQITSVLHTFLIG